MFNFVIISINTPASYGVRCISSVLKRRGVNVQLIFFDNGRLSDVRIRDNRMYESLVGLIGELNPGLVGISLVSTFNHPTGADIARRIKASLDVPVIFGGTHPTLLPRFCMDSAPIDYVCVGEGEESMVELCKSLSAGRSAADIPGIYTRGKDGYTPGNPPADLDALPFQDIGNDNKFSILPDGAIKKGDPFLNGIMPRFVTKCSRGCPFGCSFCSNAHIMGLYDAGKYLRRRSAINVIDEIKYFLSLDPVNLADIWFEDEIFPSDKLWVEEFSALYEKEVRQIPFVIWAHPIKTKDENIANLAKAGLVEAIMGVESASSVTRKLVYKRGETTEQVIKSIDILHRYGVKATLDFVVDHPWESATELKDIFDLIIDRNAPVTANMHSLIILPNTGLAKRAVEEGVMTREEIMCGLLDDPFDGVRKFQWRERIPVHKDLKRTLWIFLIMCAQNPEIPRRLLKLAAASEIMNKYPVLIVDIEVLSYHDFAALAEHSPLLKKLSKIPSLNGLYFAAWFIFRIAARMPALAVYGDELALQKTQFLLSQRKLGVFSFYKALREIKGFFKILDTVSDEGREIYIRGAGKCGQRTLEILLEIGVKVSGFIDGSESLVGTEISGIPVNSKKILKEGRRHFIVIASMYFAEIEEELNLSGYRKYRDYWTNNMSTV
jgi:radical SAM superfamily enzyme YgiQ (UPF0313 family)